MSLFTGEVVAVVTGASSGIGAGAAVKLIEKGVTKLCLTGRNLEALKETKQKCLQKSKNKVSKEDIILVDGDLTKEDVCARVVASTIEKFNRIDILVNNAGIYIYEAFETCPVEDYDFVMNINVRSVIILTQKCIPYLKASKGNIVNVSSVSGLTAMINCTYYCMSKAALDMFTKCLSVELAPKGVRVNSVNPGIVTTNIQNRDGWDEQHQKHQKFLEKTETTHPIGRHGEVEEVANLITFLASSEASLMTGSLVSADGGWLHNRNTINWCPERIPK